MPVRVYRIKGFFEYEKTNTFIWLQKVKEQNIGIMGEQRWVPFSKDNK